MATQPKHVNPGDPATATFVNNLEDWVGTPVQMTGWSGSPIGTPPAGAEIQQMAGSASVTTNASGVATIALPVAFPNNLSWWTASPTSTNTFTARPTAAGANSSTIAFVCLNAAGSVVASAAVTLFWEALGY